jgi:hypothetical protein
MKNNLTEKLQVLLTKEDQRALNIIIARRSLEQGVRPVSLSSYVREVIKEHITENTPEQKSFVVDVAKEILKNHKKNG